MLKPLLLASAFALASGATAVAQTAPIDPLHLCYTTGCSPFGGVTISTGSPPPSTAGLSNWGFSSSPADQSGTLVISILIPANETETVLPSISGQLNGTALGFTSITDVATFGPGQDLTTVLGIPASPPNPYDAYAGATAALDPGFTAGTSNYVALEVTVTNPFTTGLTGGQTPTLDNTFALSGGSFIDTLLSGNPLEPGLPDGTIVTGFLEGTSHGTLSTAQSSSLVLDTFSVVPGPPLGVPDISTWAALLTGFGFVALLKRRSRRFGDRLATLG